MAELAINNRSALIYTVLVASLGYFVDMYDLLLFGIVRVQSLASLGFTGQSLINYGVLLLDIQMAGMLIGGIVLGILGDKKGRLYVLFGSILLYSAANIANAFVFDIISYSVARFFAGVGLAGELGAAITLVSEILPTEKRGYGTAIVASVGIMGSVTAAFVGDFLYWKVAYLVGGALGVCLLILRFKMLESGMFKNMNQLNVRRGDFISLFTHKDRFVKYIKCILIGLPTWFVVGVLITFSPEFAVMLKVKGLISAGQSIMWTYIGLVFGDIVSGFGSQFIKSRKKTVLIFMLLTMIFVAVYLFSNGLTVFHFYLLTALLGFSIGYWAVFVTIGSEQFGTNIRATVATTVPNFVRGSTIPITLSFNYLRYDFGMVNSAIIVGSAVMIISFIALFALEETYHKNLDYFEEY